MADGEHRSTFQTFHLTMFESFWKATVSYGGRPRMALLLSFGAACGRQRPQLLLVAIGVLALSVAGAGVRLAQQWRDET